MNQVQNTSDPIQRVIGLREVYDLWTLGLSDKMISYAFIQDGEDKSKKKLFVEVWYNRVMAMKKVL